MKKIFISFVVSFLVFANFAMAEENFMGDENDTEETQEMEEIKDLDVVVSDIMKAQNVTDEKNVECKKIEDEDFEELGESIMEKMAGSNEAHEVMDRMMGGEGSKQLEYVHVTLGKQYFGCVSGKYGMMGSFGRMMGGGSQYGYDDDYIDDVENVENVYSTYAQGSMMGGRFGAFGFPMFMLLRVVGALIFIPLLVYLSSMAWRAGMGKNNLKK